MSKLHPHLEVISCKLLLIYQTFATVQQYNVVGNLTREKGGLGGTIIIAQLQMPQDLLHQVFGHPQLLKCSSSCFYLFFRLEETQETPLLFLLLLCANWFVSHRKGRRLQLPAASIGSGLTRLTGHGCGKDRFPSAGTQERQLHERGLTSG
jgi:hypothetical protein